VTLLYSGFNFILLKVFFLKTQMCSYRLCE